MAYKYLKRTMKIPMTTITKSYKIIFGIIRISRIRTIKIFMMNCKFFFFSTFLASIIISFHNYIIHSSILYFPHSFQCFNIVNFSIFFMVFSSSFFIFFRVPIVCFFTTFFTNNSIINFFSTKNTESRFFSFLSKFTIIFCALHKLIIYERIKYVN